MVASDCTSCPPPCACPLESPAPSWPPFKSDWLKSGPQSLLMLHKRSFAKSGGTYVHKQGFGAYQPIKWTHVNPSELVVLPHRHAYSSSTPILCWLHLYLFFKELAPHQEWWDKIPSSPCITLCSCPFMLDSLFSLPIFGWAPHSQLHYHRLWG